MTTIRRWVKRSLSLLLSLPLAGCTVVGSMTEGKEPQTIFLGLSTSTPEHYDLSLALLDELRRFASPVDFLTIDLQSDGKSHILYASPANRLEIKQIGTSLPPNVPASPGASLIQVLTRYRQYSLDSSQPVRAIIVTEGTEDKEVISTLLEISEELKENHTGSLCLIGLDAKKRIATVSAFSPIRDSVTSGQGSLEWKKCLDSIIR